MRRTAMSGALILALAIVAVSAAPGSGRPGAVPRDVGGVMGGAFIFETFGFGPYDFIAHGEATGTLRHLGLAKLYTTHQPNPNGDGTLIDTEFRIVAANGDQLWGTYPTNMVTFAGMEGSDWPFTYYYNGRVSLLISGGTGRFAHASGTIDATFLETIKVYDEYWTKYECSVAWALDGQVNY